MRILLEDFKLYESECIIKLILGKKNEKNRLFLYLQSFDEIGGFYSQREALYQLIVVLHIF